MCPQTVLKFLFKVWLNTSPYVDLLSLSPGRREKMSAVILDKMDKEERGDNKGN
jgi:hypothetical protein